MQTDSPKYQWRPPVAPEKATSDPLDHDRSDRDRSSPDLPEDDCDHDPSPHEKELFIPAILAARMTLGKLYTAPNEVACDQGHRDVHPEDVLRSTHSAEPRPAKFGPRTTMDKWWRQTKSRSKPAPRSVHPRAAARTARSQWNRLRARAK